MLETQIAKLQSKKDDYVADTVISASEFPYKKHTVVIRGYGYDSANIFDINKLEMRLYHRKLELSQEFKEIDDFVNSVEDSNIRQIIQYKYVKGLSWAATSSQVYDNPIENRARMAMKRFLEKI